MIQTMAKPAAEVAPPPPQPKPPMQTIRGVSTADLHIGIDNVGGLNAHGYPARVDDFFANFDKAVQFAINWPADLFVIGGDLTKGRNPPQRVLVPLLDRLDWLRGQDITTVIVRGNHDGDSDEGQANVLDAAGLLGPGIWPFNRPECQLVKLHSGASLWVMAVPWPRMVHLVAKAEGMSYDALSEAADHALRLEIARLTPTPDQLATTPLLVVAHLSVAGADQASERWMTLGWDPILVPPDFPRRADLICLGHYHRPHVFCAPEPGEILHGRTMYYNGSIAKVDFGEEGQDKAFWTFELASDGEPGCRCLSLDAHSVGDRPFITRQVEVPADVQEPTGYVIREVLDAGPVTGAVVRVRANFPSSQVAAAFEQGKLEQALHEAGAWWIAGIQREAPRAERHWGYEGDASMLPAPDLLRAYLEGAEPDQDRQRRLWEMGAQIMAEEP